MSDTELRTAFKNLEPKSDWERLFSNKVDNQIDFNQLLDDIRKYRNHVAHCKLFGKDAYINCIKNVKKLNSEIIKAIQITETHDFSIESVKQITQSFANIRINLAEMVKNMSTVVSGVFERAASQASANISTNIRTTLLNLTQQLTTELYDDNELDNYIDNAEN